MAEALKPCPFCGNTEQIDFGMNALHCDNCAASASENAWNTRPLEDARDAEIATLRAEIAELRGKFMFSYTSQLEAEIATWRKDTPKLTHGTPQDFAQIGDCPYPRVPFLQLHAWGDEMASMQQKIAKAEVVLESAARDCSGDQAGFVAEQALECLLDGAK